MRLINHRLPGKCKSIESSNVASRLLLVVGLAKSCWENLPMNKATVSTDNAPKAIGPYEQGIKVGDFVYASGQIPLDPKTGNLIAGGIAEQTHQVMKNLRAVLEA